MGRSTRQFELSTPQRKILEKLERAHTTGQRLADRIRIVLQCADGLNNMEVATELGVDEQRVWRWRRRWFEATNRLASAQEHGATNKELRALIVETLSDAYRCGGPQKFSAEQVALIIALACEKPADSGLPVSHWTPPELAKEAIDRGIVTSISPRQVDRFLQEVDLRPHKTRYWLNSKTKEEDPERYAGEVRGVCDAYAQAQQLNEQGVHTVSTDEKTGMQALERIAPTKPARPGFIERVEFEYKRHGTLCLIPSFMVATGRINVATIGPTRTEEDFANHVERTMDIDPQAGWVWVSDQLNTHMSEALVRLIATRCGIDGDLGVKGKRGILKSMASRKKFLENPAHSIRFVYTPKHSSWLNQVECWFSVLARRFLNRANFFSLQDLETRLKEFIRYFNAVLAKPYKWTYTGRPLQTGA